MSLILQKLSNTLSVNLVANVLQISEGKDLGTKILI
jgi:hypothetical protein